MMDLQVPSTTPTILPLLVKEIQHGMRKNGRPHVLGHPPILARGRPRHSAFSNSGRRTCIALFTTTL